MFITLLYIRGVFLLGGDNMKISGKYIIEIGTFLENYYMLGYTWKETLTHDVLSQFLHQKGRRSVRLIISNIQKEDILTGECIFVRDEVGQVIPYKNPLRNFTNITNANASELEEIRKKLLNEISKNPPIQYIIHHVFYF